MKKQQPIQGQVDLKDEPYQVVIKMGEIPYYTRLTYSKKNQGRIIEIEEISIEGNESVLHNCKFKGKSTQGDGCSYMKELRTLANDMKVSDWSKNEAIYKEEYYKHH